MNRVYLSAKIGTLFISTFKSTIGIACVKKVLKSLKHLVVTNKMITFATETHNSVGDNLKQFQL